MGSNSILNILPDNLSEEIILSVPIELRRGSLQDDEKASVESALINIKGIAERTGVRDWSNIRILDFGCGVKFTQALVQYDINIKAYVGMDVHKGIIKFLQDHVQNPNFYFYDVPFQNDMYNQSGIKLTPVSILPGEILQYDLIILQSVFTHFAKDDFLNLLHVLRKYSSSNTRLFFTCFINDGIENDSFDSVPEKPLFKVLYKKAYVKKMLENSRWELINDYPPSLKMTYQFICKPIN
jgi:hypothetical protein